MNREQLFRFFLIGVLLFLLYQILRILSPFYTGILGAIVLTLIFFPWHRMVLHRVGPKHKNTAAVLSTTLVVLAITVPLTVCFCLFLRELPQITPALERLGDGLERWRQGGAFFEVSWLKSLELQIKDSLNIPQFNFQKVILSIGNDLLGMVAAVGRRLTRNIFLFVVNFLVMVFTLFFLFRDGQGLFRKGKDLMPMEDKHKDEIANQLYITVTAVVRGLFVVAVAQGTLAGIGFALAGVPSPVFLGFLTMVMALIPLVGSTIVWLPVTLYYLTQGMMVKGIFLLIWGMFVVGLVDNFLRSILIGSKARLPIFFLFFGLLGGVRVYGPMGLFLGPLVLALLIAFIAVYREEYSPFGRGRERSNNV